MQHVKSFACYDATTYFFAAFHYVDGELKLLVVPHKAFGSDKRLLHLLASQCDLLEVALALSGTKSSMDVINVFGDDRNALQKTCVMSFGVDHILTLIGKWSSCHCKKIKVLCAWLYK